MSYSYGNGMDYTGCTEKHSLISESFELDLFNKMKNIQCYQCMFHVLPEAQIFKNSLFL